MMFKCDLIRYGSPFLFLESRLVIELRVLNRFWKRKAQIILTKASFR